MASNNQEHDFILLKIIDSYEYSPLSKSVRFIQFINSLDQNKRNKLLDGFARYLQVTIVSQITQAIKSQKFKVAFKPLSPQYLDYKRRNKLELGFWRSTGFLLNNLKYWKYGNEYRIGWPQNLKHPGVPGKNTKPSRISVVQIAKYLEFGTNKTTARPLFLPVVKYVSKNISYFLDKYLQTINLKYF